MYKEIHIGNLILARLKEMDISEERLCNFFDASISDIEKDYQEKSLDTDILLRWSKLLEYDFFRPYSQHLILYSPCAKEAKINQAPKSSLFQFRKNLYTKELIEFILELIESEVKTKKQVIEEYRIPKTTLHKWIDKYGTKGK